MKNNEALVTLGKTIIIYSLETVHLVTFRTSPECVLILNDKDEKGIAYTTLSHGGTTSLHSSSHAESVAPPKKIHSTEDDEKLTRISFQMIV